MKKEDSLIEVDASHPSDITVRINTKNSHFMALKECEMKDEQHNLLASFPAILITSIIALNCIHTTKKDGSALSTFNTQMAPYHAFWGFDPVNLLPLFFKKVFTSSDSSSLSTGYEIKTKVGTEWFEATLDSTKFFPSEKRDNEGKKLFNALILNTHLWPSISREKPSRSGLKEALVKCDRQDEKLLDTEDCSEKILHPYILNQVKEKIEYLSKEVSIDNIFFKKWLEKMS